MYKDDSNVKMITMINKISPFDPQTSIKLTTFTCLIRFSNPISRRAVIGNWKRKIIFKTHKYYFFIPGNNRFMNQSKKLTKENLSTGIEVGSTHMTGMEVGSTYMTGMEVASTMPTSHRSAHFLRLDRRFMKTTMEPSKSFSFITKPSFIYLNPTRFQ